MSDVAFIGLGTMGRGMVRNLYRAGNTVTAWNRTRRPLPAELDSVAQAESIAAAIRGKSIVFVCVTGPDAQRAVFDELLDCLGPDVLVIDSTTTDPAESVRIAQALAERGSRYLDAPVFGSKSEAWEGRLDFVCGGAEATFRNAEPLLRNLAATVHHIGASGAGATMKLIGNLLVAAQMVSLGEALALARRAGLDGEAVVRVFDVTDYSSGLIRGVSRASLRNDFSPSFYLRHMLKDVRLIEDLARRLAVPLPATAPIGPLYQAAVNEGLETSMLPAFTNCFFPCLDWIRLDRRRRRHGLGHFDKPRRCRKLAASRHCVTCLRSVVARLLAAPFGIHHGNRAYDRRHKLSASIARAGHNREFDRARVACRNTVFARR
ncbi:MAG TPA: NAD(P)-dependent oxidoreductase [Roseiarcus sp.]|nr:NAD(P)-dependent oxidoreductase [Roseiarcus sp.]